MTTDDPDRTKDELLVEIRGLMLDPRSNVPIVILRSPELHRDLPIWIGPNEANAIAMRLEEVEPPRPMTHDLLADAFEELGGSVSRIVICDLRDNTFFARIEVAQGDAQRDLDSRPSDAIAIALRADAPIFAARHVLEQAGVAIGEPDAEAEEEHLREWLENASTEDLGEYEM